MRRARIRTGIVVGVLTSVLATGAAGLPGGGTEARADAPDRRVEQGKAPKALATEQAAVQAATDFDKPVEILSLRTERGQTFANPNGTFTAREYAQPVRTRVNGEWTDIDTTLVAQLDGRLAPKATSTAMSVSGGGDSAFATVIKDGKSLSVSWPGKLPKPAVEGSTATYESVLPGVDLVVRAENDGFSHVLVVKSAEAAANPKLASLALPVAAPGLDVRGDDDGGLVVRDKSSGGTVFEAPQPLMWDSSGSRPRGSEIHETGPGPSDGARTADVGLEVRENTMVLKPDTGLLRARSTKYPVFIDPVTKTASRTAWTWVSSANPGLEGWKFSNSADGVESGKGVGLCPANVSVRCTGSNDVQRQYYAMPTGSYEGKRIIKAEFAITLLHTYNDDGRSVQLHRVNSSGGSAINSGTNWSNKPSSKDHITSKSPTNPTGSCTATNQNVRFGVTGTIQKAADAGWDSTTFGLKAADETSYASWKRFCNNAALEIEYNRLPYQPQMDELDMDPGGRCEYGRATKHYTKKTPTLSAIIWDPDHGDVPGQTEKLKAQFEIFWTAKDGSQKSHTVTTGYLNSNSDGGKNPRSSGWEQFEYKVGTDIDGDGTAAFTLPQNTVIGWWVRGSDGSTDSNGKLLWGPWSNEGDSTRCEFILDSTKPEAPTVTSAQYPNDGSWHEGIGDYGTFTMHSPDADVARYRYQFSGEAEKTVTPAEPGKPAVIRWMPKRERSTSLYVEAEDQAGNSKEITTSYRFRVTKGRAPKASWALSDEVGSAKAAGGDGAPNATAGSGVTFGVKGPHGSSRTAARLNGTSDAYLNAGQHIVDTDKTFSVAAWVRLSELPTTSMSVVSQDGSAQSGFSLGYDAKTKRWSFLAPDSEIDSMIAWEVLGPKPVPGEWTHLVGVYDKDEARTAGSVPGTMRMYVNGTLVSGDIQERPTAWNATGSLQIGRALEPSGYIANLKGTVADVQVFNRVVTADETSALGGMPPLQLAYWDMDEAGGGVVPEHSGGTGLTLRGSSTIYQPDEACDPLEATCVPPAPPLWGDGHLALDGSTGYARRASGLLNPRTSFTVTARARLTSLDSGKDQTVLSLPGTDNTAVVVRYDAGKDRWQLALTQKDSAGATVTQSQVDGSLPTVEGQGDHLTLAYNALFGEVRLYVNGQWNGEVVKWPDNAWDLSTVGIQVGRTGIGSAGSEYFSGSIDEVRVFEGALDEPLAAAVVRLKDDTNLGDPMT